jgi:hypothetical protein
MVLGHEHRTCRTESCPLSQKSASVIVPVVDSPRLRFTTRPRSGTEQRAEAGAHRPDRTHRGRESQTNHSRTALCHLSPLSRSPSLIISRPYVKRAAVHSTYITQPIGNCAHARQCSIEVLEAYRIAGGTSGNTPSGTAVHAFISRLLTDCDRVRLYSAPVSGCGASVCASHVRSA